MDPEKAQAAKRFVRDLNELRDRAGRPSYSTLERLSRHDLRRSTVSDVLNGNRVNLPDWRFVAAFVAACREEAEKSGLDASELGTVADWKRHWDSASHGVLDARFPGSGYPSPSRREWPGPTADDSPETALAPGEATTSADGEGSGTVTRSLPSVWGLVPPRLNDFVGRESWLAGIRQTLASTSQVSAVILQGLCGIGKTQLAVEYAHRTASEYDLVWWIPCASLESAHRAMADLESSLGIAAVRMPEENRYASLFNFLQQDERRGRWLLIFDNANEPDIVRDLIPPGNGHVLVTSRNSRWEASGEMLELEAFSRTESVEFIRRRMRRDADAAAHLLAEAVGDLPLLLEHAAESHHAISEYIERLDRDPLSLLNARPSDYQGTIAGEWEAVLEQLRNRVPDAMNLLACLCFFGDKPIPRESLERGSYLQDISIHAVLVDPIRRNRAIMMLRRAGLLRVRAATRTLEVHQATRRVVRAMVKEAGVGDAQRYQHDAHLLLAAADPLDPEDPASWRGYAELCEHVAQSGASECADETVRRLVINLALFLTAAGDPWAAVTLADEALSYWTADEANSGVSAACMAMRRAKAGALLARGQPWDAFQLQQETLAMMRSAPGSWGREVVLLNRMTGARYRMTGNFPAARQADLESVRAHVAEFGEDHPHTFPALSAVITDLALNGGCAEAVNQARRVYADCLAFYNDPGNPTVLFHQSVLGRCFWLRGSDQAVSILAEVNAGYQAAVGAGTMAENHPWYLAHQVDYALARRDDSRASGDLGRLADDLHRAHRRCWQTLGGNHPQTLAASLALASVLRRDPRQLSQAVRLVADTRRRYEETLPNHPFTTACRGYLAAISHLASASSSPTVSATTAADLKSVVDGLGESVGERHPLTLAAVMALANVLADMAGSEGDLEAAVQRAREAREGFRACVGPDHPHALASAANLATIQGRFGHPPDGSELRERYEQGIGAGHADARLFAEDDLIYIDFSPLSL